MPILTEDFASGLIVGMLGMLAFNIACWAVEKAALDFIERHR